MERNLWETIKRLAPLAPNFVSLPMAREGSTRERTHSTIARILAETELLPAAHLTCVGAARGEIDDIVGRYHDIGVRHIVALRGDPPDGIGTAYTTHPDGYRSSTDLVAGIKRQHADIEVSVSAYPRSIRKAATSMPTSISLKAKSMPAQPAPSPRCSSTTISIFVTSTGARARGIAIPIVPGIMPMHNFKQARQLCHPGRHHRAVVACWKNSRARRRSRHPQTGAATVAAGQVQNSPSTASIPFNFYTMNRADLVFAISHLLGIRPSGAQKAA